MTSSDLLYICHVCRHLLYYLACKFSCCMYSRGFRDRTSTNVGEMSFSPPIQHTKTILTLVLFGVESWLIAQLLHGSKTYAYCYIS